MIIRSRPPVQKPIVDPSQIVITKTIKRNNKSEKKTATNLVINRNLEKAHAKVKKEEDLATSPVQQPQSLPEKSKIVLLCNLDPRATAKDIGVSWVNCRAKGFYLCCLCTGYVRHVWSDYKL